MPGLIEKYRDCLPLPADSEAISLCEGATPLIQLRNIPKLFDIDLELYVKYEGLNPTGSFKDRGMTVAVSHAVSEKTKSDYLRIHWQHFGIGGGLCGASRNALLCVDTRR